MKKGIFDNVKTGKELAALREESGIFAKEVAEYFGKDVRTIYRWETGKGLTPFYADSYRNFIVECATRWEAHFQQLLTYKKRYGNCNVPKDYPRNPELSQWVQQQRLSLKMAITSSRRASARRTRLDKIGFVWSCNTD